MPGFCISLTTNQLKLRLLRATLLQLPASSCCPVQPDKTWKPNQCLGTQESRARLTVQMGLRDSISQKCEQCLMQGKWFQSGQGVCWRTLRLVLALHSWERRGRAVAEVLQDFEHRLRVFTPCVKTKRLVFASCLSDLSRVFLKRTPSVS